MASQDFEKFNIALKTAILQSKQTQRRVARRTRIDETRLSRIVRGQVVPFPREKRALARVLGVAIDVLFPEPAHEVHA
jgi:transcriptional regulator with XRE-family HTH domain